MHDRYSRSSRLGPSTDRRSVAGCKPSARPGGPDHATDRDPTTIIPSASAQGDAAGAADHGRSEPTGAAGSRWTARPWVHPTERAEAGKAARKRVPRTSHAAFEPRRTAIRSGSSRPGDGSAAGARAAASRADGESARFAYYRGTPAVMAFDLADDAADGHPGPGEW